MAFFVIALVCHGELARRRPAARHLTAFYMWMSAGGMIGGIAAGLIAPARLQLGRRVSDPDRARRSCAGPGCRLGRDSGTLTSGLALARLVLRRRSSPALFSAIQLDDKRPTMIAIGGAAGDLARVLARPAEIRR